MPYASSVDTHTVSFSPASSIGSFLNNHS
jgi:hypothetical protein